MAYRAIEVRKVTPHIGAEIHGVDLAEPLDEPTFKQVHDALIEHCVIFFRDQRISADQQKAFGRRFGDLHLHPAYPPRMLLKGHREVMLIHADEKSKRVAGEDWHSDVSCDAEPPMGTGTWRRPSSSAASPGSPAPSPSGTTGAPSTTRSGTTTRTAGTAIG